MEQREEQCHLHTKGVAYLKKMQDGKNKQTYVKSHHLSAYGTVNGTQPGAIPPVGYNTGTYMGTVESYIK